MCAFRRVAGCLLVAASAFYVVSVISTTPSFAAEVTKTFVNTSGVTAQDFFVQLSPQPTGFKDITPAGWTSHFIEGGFHFHDDGDTSVPHGSKFVVTWEYSGTQEPKILKKYWTSDGTKSPSDARIKSIAWGMEIDNSPGDWTGGVQITVEGKHTYVTVNGTMTSAEKAQAIRDEINTQYPSEDWEAEVVEGNFLVIKWKTGKEKKRRPKVSFKKLKDTKERDKKDLDGIHTLLKFDLSGVPTGSGVEGGQGVISVDTNRGTASVLTSAGMPISVIISDLVADLAGLGEDIVDYGDQYFVLEEDEATLFFAFFGDESGVDLTLTTDHPEVIPVLSRGHLLVLIIVLVAFGTGVLIIRRRTWQTGLR